LAELPSGEAINRIFSASETDISQISGLKSLTRLMFTPEPEDKVPYVLNMLHPASWLQEKDEDDAQGRTNYEVQKAVR
jgi:hypothetical protein